MQMKTWVATIMLAGGLSLAGGAAVSADCHEGAVDASGFFVDGELDVSAYLAAVEAALAACAPGTAPGTLPATGSNTSPLLPLALGLTAIGGAAVVSTGVRRRSANR